MAEHDHQKCIQFFERLSELVDGELDRITVGDIEAHIRDCPACQACWSTFKKSVEIFQNLGQEPAPPDFVDQLKDFVASNLQKDARP